MSENIGPYEGQAGEHVMWRGQHLGDMTREELQEALFVMIVTYRAEYRERQRQREFMKMRFYSEDN